MNEIKSGRKLKTNPVVETVLGIEDLLMKTEVNWSISYEPSSKSYTVFIADLSEEEPKPKQDLDDEIMFDTEFIFDSESDCQVLIQHLRDVEKLFGLVTVADLYDYLEINRPEYSTRYGWLTNDINSIHFIYLPSECYVLKIAKPKRIV